MTTGTQSRIAARKTAALKRIRADKRAQGRSYPMPGPADKVLALKDAAERSMAQRAGSHTCVDCGERNRPSLTVCWNCTAPIAQEN